MTGEVETMEAPVRRAGLEASFDASELLVFCRDLRGSLADAVVAAVGRSLAAHPAFVDAACGGATGVGIVVDAGGQLVVPVVRNALEAPLPRVRAEVARLVEAAFSGALALGDVGGAAVTVDDHGLWHGAAGGATLTVSRPAGGSPELSLVLVTPPGVDANDAAAFFATVVRLLRLPYRRLV